MAMHGVDGAFLQRFAGQCEVDGRTQGGNADIMRLRDEVGDRVREAAEKEGRVFAIMCVPFSTPTSRFYGRVDLHSQVRCLRRCSRPHRESYKGRLGTSHERQTDT